MSLDKNILKLGDHIYAKRLLHSHHGIYTGDDQVIHFKGDFKEKSDPVVRETSLEEFLRGGNLRRKEYKHRLPPEETVQRVRQFLSGHNYSLIQNNCEHMATYCVTGKPSSRQVRRGTIGLIFTTILGAIGIGILTKKSKNG